MSAIHCFFCGGKDCKWENWKPWADKPGANNALDGLYSNWITPNILAMQRPSTRLMAAFGLPAAFRAAGLASIFNLEEAGEHAACGDGIEASSGFSYLPEAWMDAGVFYYNFGWQDMNVPDFSHMLSIAQVMAYALEDGQKIAVHCHAGLGRTGLAIACYLVYGLNMESNKAIALVRRNRPLSVQTRKQVLFVQQFEEHIKPFKVYFPGICSRSPTEYSSVQLMSLESVLANQRRIFHGDEQKIMRYVPKIVAAIVARLKVLSATDDKSRKAMISAFASFNGVPEMTEQLIVLQSDINAGQWAALSGSEVDVHTLVSLLLYWVISLRSPLLLDEQVFALSAAESDNERLLGLDRGALYTLNIIIDALRPAADDDEQMQAALKTLAVLVTSQRANIARPYFPRLLYAPTVTPPLPPAPSTSPWKAWAATVSATASAAHSRTTSATAGLAALRQTAGSPPPPIIPRPPPVLAESTPPPPPPPPTKEEFLAAVLSFLTYLLNKCTAAAPDGRPVPASTPGLLLPQTPDTELSQSELLVLASRAAAAASTASLHATQRDDASSSSTSLSQQQPPPLPHRPPPVEGDNADFSLTGSAVPLLTPQPPAYWARILRLMDTLFDAGGTIFTDREAGELRRYCLLKHDALEIAFEAYGDGDVEVEVDAGSQPALEKKYARFARALRDLVAVPLSPALSSTLSAPPAVG
ncbi:Protein tyrosine phosphatase domain-containing protein 1 [Geranomyces variabilis]|nr:Protein tyrosine phosphatase domain-containing protein 1 [Geranomyces variabilis]